MPVAARPIAVALMKRDGRPYWEAQWVDPKTGRKRTKSTGQKIRREAERWVGRFKKELVAGADGPGRVTWAAFVARLERDFLPDKRPATVARYRTTVAAVERHLNPLLLTAVDAEAVGRLKAAMRAAGNADATVASYLRHLKAALRWAYKIGLLADAPTVDVPATEAAAKGRPLTDAEFARLLAAVPGVVGEDRAAGWVHLLRGLWLSGLRIGEAVGLTWDDAAGIRVRLDGKFPAVFIPGRLQKGKRDTVTPLTPDFAAFLADTPERDRAGFVFAPEPAPGRTVVRLDSDWVGRVIGDIGRACGVEVKPGKCATAHDLRRSFCFRWAQRVLPQHLKALARHRSVTTTLAFYAEADAGMTADAVWAAVASAVVANGSANAGPSDNTAAAGESAADH